MSSTEEQQVDVAYETGWDAGSDGGWGERSEERLDESPPVQSGPMPTGQPVHRQKSASV